MPIEFSTDEQEALAEVDEQTGGKLRQKLEQTIADNKALTERLSVHDAREFLADKGMTLVKPEDLKGIAPDQFEAHATKVQEDRRTMQEDLLREALGRQGLDGEELDEALANMVAKQAPQTEDAEATQRARLVGSVAGTPVPRIDPSKVVGFDAIKAGIEAQARKRTQRS